MLLSSPRITVEVALPGTRIARPSTSTWKVFTAVPSNRSGFQLSVRAWSCGFDTRRPDGAGGGWSGRIRRLGSLHSPGPALFTACTWKVYHSPLVSPVIRQPVAGQEVVRPRLSRTR